MSFDDELRNRMRSAAEHAGAAADPAAAAARVAAATSSSPAAGVAATLKIVGGLGLVGLVTGALLGATVLQPDPTVDASAVGIDVRSGATFDCPGGSVVGTLRSGDRVFVVGRNDSGDWSALRQPDRIGIVVWVPAEALQPDTEPLDVPVVECTTSQVGVAAPTDTEPVPDTTDLPVADSTVPDSTSTDSTSTTTPATTTPRHPDPAPLR